MARAYPSPQPQDYGQEVPGSEWRALRGELVALLDQVEDQVARTGREDDGYQSIAERMRRLREQVGDDEPQTRHREALRSVKRAVDRFSERDESFGPRPEAYGRDERGFAPNPRDTLQSAIQQIRTRQRESATSSRAMEAQRYVEPAPRVIDSPRFDELAHAVGGLSGRLERLEGELRSAAKMQTGNVKEIAEQVAQLSHVVELLAGAVGETGQVKRLEGQIAGLAKLVAQGQQVDLSALTRRLDDLGTTVGSLVERQNKDAVSQRLDDVSSTMGRLADLQVQFANRVDGTSQQSAGIKEGMSAIEASMRSLEATLGGSAEATGAVREGMRAIEEGVRNVYDRIDAIEKNTALSPEDVDRLSSEMARFTEAMKNPVQPQGLIELVDDLNSRIAGIESSHRDVGGLKSDVEALRTAVIEAVEPRFAAIEMQLEALSDRFGDQRAGDTSVGQLEAQVRQLVARMDQTGEQLSGLSRMYQPVEREPAPDFEALADLVAARTSEAIAQNAAPMPVPQGLSDDGIDEIEKRLSRLFASVEARGGEDLSGIEGSIREVSERLARLESSLVEKAKAAEQSVSTPLDTMVAQQVVEAAPAAPPAAARSMDEPDAKADEVISALAPPPPAPRHDPIASLLNEAAESAGADARVSAPAPRGDAMPKNPAEDAPLTDRPFGDAPSPVKSALEAKNGPRKRHPGLSYEEPGADAPPPAPVPSWGSDAADVEPAPQRPDFDPSKLERPPRPVSSFDSDEPAVFTPPSAESVVVEPAPTPSIEPAPSANTFIAAARRAAQRPAAKAATGGGPGSLIARALASFQAGGKDPAEAPLAGEDDGTETAKTGKARKARRLAGDKQARTEWKPDDAIDAGPIAPQPIAPDHEAPGVGSAEKQESFLSRHRRPILLGVSLVAIALLTLNLISQRLGGEPATPAPTPAPAPADTSSLEQDVRSPLANEPVANMPVLEAGPRVVPIVDNLATASIDPAASRGFSTEAELPEMPAAFAAAASAGPATPAIEAVDVAAIAPLAFASDSTALESPIVVEMPPPGVGPDPLRKAAAEGDARAQFEIAAIYTEGRAVPEDLATAAIWYERAAAQGFAPAQYRLGNLFENGKGVAKDLVQAKLWYQRAAEAGNRMAMHNLAALYAGGQLGKQEFDTAAEWFEQAAQRGLRDSQFNLGMLYARGLGVPQSLEDSYRWFARAALRGDGDAQKARDDVARSLDAETVGRLNAEAAAFVPVAIEIGANFAPIGTWSQAFDPGETITNRDVILSVQAALTALGYDVGTPDGLSGPKTAEAIRAFERATGMSEYGQVNPRLLAVLGSQPV